MTALNLDRKIPLRMKTYLVRHDSGECFEIEAHTLARARELIEAECQDRGWLLDDIDWREVEEAS